MDLLEQAQHFLESKGFLVEGRTEAQELGYIQNELGFMDADSANVMYYIGRYISNKGPQTEGAIEKYLNSKFGNTIPNVELVEDDFHDQHTLTWQRFLNFFFAKDGRKYDFSRKAQEMWDNVAKWHEANAESEDPNAKYVKQFFDWYNDKKKGNETNPPKDLIKFVNSTSAEDVEKAFGKYYKFAMGQLDKGTADYWKNRGKIEQDEIDDFNEAYKALTDAGYVIVEDTIDDVLQHGLSPFDKARLNKGQKPSWAAKVTEIGPRPARPKRSQDWTERAMDSVTGVKRPYSESDWRRDNELNLKGNQQIEQRLKAILNVSAKVEATKDYVGVYTQDKAFYVESRGITYFVKMVGNNSVFDRKAETVKSLSDVAKFIEENV